MHTMCVQWSTIRLHDNAAYVQRGSKIWNRFVKLNEQLCSSFTILILLLSLLIDLGPIHRRNRGKVAERWERRGKWLAHMEHMNCLLTILRCSNQTKCQIATAMMKSTICNQREVQCHVLFQGTGQLLHIASMKQTHNKVSKDCQTAKAG